MMLMTDRMSNTINRAQIINGVQRRFRWSAAEKMRLVEETFASGMTARCGQPERHRSELARPLAALGVPGQAGGHRNR